MREFGSEFEIEYARDYYFDNLATLKKNNAFTRSGREAIGLAAKSIPSGVVLMPAYCCWSMELPFEEANHTIEYYRLNEDLSVDIEFLMKQIDIYNPKAVLIMNYFGFVPTKVVVDTIKNTNKNIVIIEDFTQSLFCLKENYNEQVDVYVASIRKSVGVPDGGIIITSLPIDKSILSDSSHTPFVRDHIVAGRMKTRYRYTADPDDKVIFRKYQGYAGKFIKENYGIYQISDEALSILNHTIVENVRVARKSNYKNLYSILSSNSKLKVLFAPSESNQAPFSMIICVENRNEVQTAMANNGVYAQVLWPLKDKAKDICIVSKYMEEHMLAIPIDQRYFYDDIIEMGKRINEVIK